MRIGENPHRPRRKRAKSAENQRNRRDSHRPHRFRRKMGEVGANRPENGRGRCESPTSLISPIWPKTSGIGEIGEYARSARSSNIPNLWFRRFAFSKLRNFLGRIGRGCGFGPRRLNFIANVRMCKCIALYTFSSQLICHLRGSGLGRCSSSHRPCASRKPVKLPASSSEIPRRSWAIHRHPRRPLFDL